MLGCYRRWQLLQLLLQLLLLLLLLLLKQQDRTAMHRVQVKAISQDIRVGMLPNRSQQAKLTTANSLVKRCSPPLCSVSEAHSGFSASLLPCRG